MKHKSNVFFVHAHPKGIGRQNKMAFFGHKRILNRAPAIAPKISMVDQMGNIGLPQPVAEFHQFSNQRKVNDSAARDLFSRFHYQIKFSIVIPNVFDIERKIGTIDSSVKQLHFFWQEI